MPENLDGEQSRRLWEYRLHIENLLYNRLNFFLILESVLLGVDFPSVLSVTTSTG